MPDLAHVLDHRCADDANQAPASCERGSKETKRAQPLDYLRVEANLKGCVYMRELESCVESSFAAKPRRRLSWELFSSALNDDSDDDEDL